jgi:hypothetical protein
MSNHDVRITNSENRFRELATKLDKVLSHFYNNINIVCNANIHLSRNHPEYLGLWKNVLYKKNLSVNDYFNAFLILARSFLYFFISILLEFFRFSRNYRTSQPKSSEVDFIFISHQIENTVTDDDSYFGGLIEDLSKSNKRVTRLLISHINPPKSQIKSGKYPTIFLNKSMNGSVLFKYFFLNLYSLCRLFFFCLRNHFTFYELVTLLIGQLSNFSLIRIIKQIEFELNTLKPKNLVITFEGNALEKAVFLLSKKSKIRCFGYQHVPLIQSQHAILRSINNALDPDIILCSGPYSRDKFKTKLGKENKILILGSPKFRRFVDKKNDTYKKQDILLVPDGNYQSINNFIALGNYLISSNYSGNVIIRSHPLFREYLETRINHLKDIYPYRLLISPGDLIEVLNSSKWVIYQNSSVAIQALLEGCNIIYLSNVLANIDPLWEQSEYRSTAATFLEIKNILETFDLTKSPNPSELHDLGRIYFSELNLEIIRDYQ